MSDNSEPVFTLGNRMRKARDNAGLEQQEIANLIGVSRQMISKYENGRNEPPLHVLWDWSKETGASIFWLVGAGPDTPTSRSEEALIAA